MPPLERLAPYLPHEGPPVPRVLPPWPATPEDVERAVSNYRRRWERAVENYRAALIRQFYRLQR